jgi:hypothetical protein
MKLLVGKSSINKKSSILGATTSVAKMKYAPKNIPNHIFANILIEIKDFIRWMVLQSLHQLLKQTKLKF